MFSGTRPTSGSGVKHSPVRLLLPNDVNKENTSKLKKIVKEYAVVIFSKRECFMAIATRTLLLKIGANPLHLEVDNLDHLRRELLRIVTVSDMHEGPPSPLVFIGGKLIGGLERVITMHVSGELVPLLKEAGALWL